MNMYEDRSGEFVCGFRDRGGGGAGRAAAPPLFCAPAPTFCAKGKIIKLKKKKKDLKQVFSVHIPLYSLYFL